jgi:large subunit ribosomal protein L6
MSRLGKKPINVPTGVTVTVAAGTIKVKGSKGELSLVLHPHVKVEPIEGGKQLMVSVAAPEEKKDRSLWGLSHKLVKNMLEGVTTGFTKQLELVGIGFKVAASGSKLNMELGYSHPVVFELPKGVEAKVEKNVVTLSGSDKQLVGQTAAQMRKLRKPEPYKGKGIRYVGEVVKMKAGKAAKTGAAAK